MDLVRVIYVYYGQPAVMSVFFSFLAARHRAILFYMFVLLIFIARWQINMMMMLSIRLRNDLYCVGWGVEPYLLTMAAEYRIRSANSDK